MSIEYIVKKNKNELSQRKKEGLLKLAKLIQVFRLDPVFAVEWLFGIQLLDFQAYVFLKSWVTPNCVWCQCRGSGKTTLGSPFIMLKNLLIPNYQAYILASSGSQSKNMFSKIEQIAKREIESFTGLNDVFFNETVKNVANKDGFTHNPNSYEFKLYNGSCTNTLNSVPDNMRGK